MSKLLASTLLATILVASGSRHPVARDATPARQPRLEVLVLEIQSCAVCALVRRHVLPRYEEAGLSQKAPMRFVDVTRRDETTLGLNRPIDTVPTVVLLRDGTEVDRISGYVAPDVYVGMLGRMVGQHGL